MNSSDIFQWIVTFVSTIAAILAWGAKLRWSEEYSKAKDETIRSKEEQIALLEREATEYTKAKDEIIRAKEAQIEELKQRIEGLSDFTSVKLREHLRNMKEGLEEIIDELRKEIDSKKQEIERIKIQLDEINQSNESKGAKIQELIRQKDKLEGELANLSKSRILVQTKATSVRDVTELTKIDDFDVEIYNSGEASVHRTYDRGLYNELLRTKLIRVLTDSNPKANKDEEDTDLGNK